MGFSHLKKDDSKKELLKKTSLELAEEALRSAVQDVVYKGHVYLTQSQNANGSFSIGKKNQGAKRAPIAVTALACLSFMAGGNTPYCGEFSAPLKKGLNYLLSICDLETGIFYADGDTTSRMHGQGYAMLALAEAYGMFGMDEASGNHKKIGKALRKSVDLVSKIQSEVGGWYYNTSISNDHEGSITICIVAALRAARNSGVHVDKQVIDKAVSYVRRSQKRNGAFSYKLNDDKTSYALTAAAVATLNYTGEYDSKAIDLGMEFMQKKDPILNIVTLENYPQYARFYAAQAYYQYKNLSNWNRWFPRFVRECKGLQYPDGSFSNQQFGAVYATAFTTLTIQVSRGYLPIFQR